ncbi:DUF2599 domain-containing protein [Dietzia cinnamea]|uniref:DUF2599 domain-containing protein n=1 Tax=Dietzia cinnamea TaxID=321318 RepID=UPI0021A31966|nr:DUF2599 domain-containing protein [Dietzia cinnamea]MCT1710567.1 DUF2599 domain-containing protein [Dietzia cinnamea]
MRHRPPLRAAALAALLAIALAGGCAADPDEPAGPETATTGTPSGPGSSSSSTTSPPPPTPPAPTAPPAPPFIAAATWADSDYGVTLEVAPTDSGRRAWGAGDAEAAWQEVLQLAPDADTPGMWEQFDCHWTWARLLEPDKPTWNVEPWRPVVSPERMLAEGCNPGGPEV